MKFLILFLMIVISIWVYLFLRLLWNNKKFFIDTLDKNYKKNKKGILSYNNISLFLDKTGSKHLFKAINPTTFMLFKIFFSLIIFTLTYIKLGIIIAIISSIIAFFFPNILLKIGNDSDNADMLPDIKRIFDTLRIQMKSGVYITEALRECYMVVKNERLKKELLELNNYIFLQHNLEKGLDTFKSKFDNPHINNLCILIKQGQETGQLVQLLEDLSTQIKDIDESTKIKLQQRIKNRLMVNQLIIFTLIMGLILYVLLYSLTSSLMNF